VVVEPHRFPCAGRLHELGRRQRASRGLPPGRTARPVLHRSRKRDRRHRWYPGHRQLPPLPGHHHRHEYAGLPSRSFDRHLTVRSPCSATCWSRTTPRHTRSTRPSAPTSTTSTSCARDHPQRRRPQGRGADHDGGTGRRPCSERAGAVRPRGIAILGTSTHCIALHASDLCVPLAALDADVHIRSAAGQRTVLRREEDDRHGTSGSSTGTYRLGVSDAGLACGDACGEAGRGGCRAVTRPVTSALPPARSAAATGSPRPGRAPRSAPPSPGLAAR
jgi:hypothetical protein